MILNYNVNVPEAVNLTTVQFPVVEVHDAGPGTQKAPDLLAVGNLKITTPDPPAPLALVPQLPLLPPPPPPRFAVPATAAPPGSQAAPPFPPPPAPPAPSGPE